MLVKGLAVETQRITQSIRDSTNKETKQLRPGVTLAKRYLIQGVIGVGGMGAVYRARDLHFPNVTKLVAVKEMINQARDPVVRNTIVRNFEREANLLATLEHRAIPRIYDYFTINERSYLVEEHISGKDLEALLTDTPGFIAEKRVLTWAVELCDVIHFLHTHSPEPIIFRDMKPSNVIITPQDHVMLVDFGIAKPFQAGQKGTMIGTEGYSPPEQYRGEAGPRADIYALGATLHHVLTRQDPRLEPPFSFSERPIRQINPDVSTQLDQVVRKALSYDPGDRFQTAEEMKLAMLNAAKETGLLREISTHLPAAKDIVKKDEAVQALWSFRCEDEIRGTPVYHNGMVYIGSYDNNLYAISSADGSFAWKYPADAGIVSRPAILDNIIFFGSEDHRLHAVSLFTGRVTWTYYTDGPVRSSPCLAEGHIFIGSDDGHIHAINAQTGRRAWRIDAGAPVRCTPLVAQDFVYFGTENGDFYCLDFSGQVKWRFKARRGITSSPVISQGVVYFSSVDSTLYALEAKTGWVIWRFRMGKASISSPVFADKYVFVGSVDGNIYCVEASNAREVWKFSTDHQVTGSPIIYKDSLYCGSVDHHLYCLEYRTGRLRWKFKTHGPITGTPVAEDDQVFCGSTDHHLYALAA